MPIHHLNEPIDIFSEWLDDCEAAAQGRNPNAGLAGGSGGGGAGGASGGGAGTQVPRYESDDDEDDLPAPSGLSSKETKQGKSKQNSPKKSNAKSSKPSYNDLGLGDSDDDSE